MAKNAVKFSHIWIDSITSPVRAVWHDLSCQSLILRVGTGERPSRVFYWYGRAAGKPTRLRIGIYPAVTLTAARDEAKRLTGIIATGQTTKPRAAMSRDEMTFGELFLWWMESHSKPHKETWQKDQTRYNQRLACWSTWKLSRITKEIVRALHLATNESSGPYAANKILELLGTVWRHGQRERGITVADPTAGIKRFAKVERERFLSATELTKFLDAVGKLRREVTRDYFLLALFTGARRANVEAMRWEHLNLDAGLWHLPSKQNKSKRPLTIVLSTVAVDILRRRQLTSASEWVLPSQGKCGHVNDPTSAMAQVLKATGIKDLRFHDLRRTLGSWQAAQGSSLLVIGKSLGHTSSQATRIYARLDLDPVRASIEAATAAMLKTPK